MAITRHDFGTFNGETVFAYEITGPGGMRARVLSFGAILQSLHAPDRNGQLADVTLGFDGMKGYLEDQVKVGALCGRVVNRIRNARFTIRDHEYLLARNDGDNHIHGGLNGFDRVLWQAQVNEAENSVTLSRLSPDGEEGYPGNLNVRVRYTLTADSELAIAMEAETDASTIVNLSTHAYWNLAGHASGSILDHKLMVDADRYTPVDARTIPTGALDTVATTPFDFRKPRPVRQNMPQGGYDINFWLSSRGGEPHLAAVLADEASGRVLELRTNQPGLQIYSGARLSPSVPGKGGVAYQPYGGFALEPQKFPDAPNHPNFPSIRLEPGEVYRHDSVFRFHTQ
ncbi:MAG: galactose mutarotase [Aestuariivirgaceae bacterium]|nr:galactose mutarotase [Aestuariivirgaceae bacterium]